MKMQLYVWEDVLCDWTCGMAFAIAPSKDKAIDAICENFGEYVKEELKNAKPRIYKLNRKNAIGFAVYGGG